MNIQTSNTGDDEITVQIKPIYGWGWRSNDGAFDVPEPFSARIDPRRNQSGSWSDMVLKEGHVFDRVTFRMSQRHLEWDGFVNITLAAGQKVTGFAIVTHGAEFLEGVK